METGTISEAMSWGAGRLKPQKGGEPVVFTERVFKADWQEAIVGRKVKYQLYAGGAEAKEVIPA